MVDNSFLSIVCPTLLVVIQTRGLLVDTDVYESESGGNEVVKFENSLTHPCRVHTPYHRCHHEDNGGDSLTLSCIGQGVGKHVTCVRCKDVNPQHLHQSTLFIVYAVLSY